MAQPNRGTSTPRSQPWVPRTQRARAGAQADGGSETTDTLHRPDAGTAMPVSDAERTAHVEDDGFSQPRLSRAGASVAARDEQPTQTFPRQQAVPAPSQPAPRKRTGPRRARLQVRHVGPWTVLKFSSLLAIALFLVWLIVIGLLYGVLDGAGVIAKINDTYATISGAGSNPPVTTGLVFSGALVAGAAGAVVFVALSTIGAVIYNLCADVVGGIEVTLAERE